MEYNVFANKLYEKYKEEKKIDKINNKVYGELLGKIFVDVKKYEDTFDGVVDISERFGGEYKTLGEYYLNSKKNGIDLVTTSCIITKNGFMFHFYDDKFTIKPVAVNGSECFDLMKPKYQKRYIAEMYKMFGEPYKKQYRDIISEKQKILDEESEFLK